MKDILDNVKFDNNNSQMKCSSFSPVSNLDRLEPAWGLEERDLERDLEELECPLFDPLL